jgi:hypothetical protein
MLAIDARPRRTLVMRAPVMRTCRRAGTGIHAALLAAATMAVAAAIAARAVAAMTIVATIAAAIAAPGLAATMLVTVRLLALSALALAMLRGTLLLAGLARVAQRLGALLGEWLGERLGGGGGTGGGGLAVVLRQVSIGAVGAVIVGAIGAERGSALTLIEAHAAIAAAATTAAAAAAAALAFAARRLVKPGHGRGIEHLGLGAGYPRGRGSGVLEIGHRIGSDHLRLSRQRGCCRHRGGGCRGLVEGLRLRGGLRGSELIADPADHRLERLDEFVLSQSATVVDLMLARQLA